MTKLLEWVSVLGLLVAIWISLLLATNEDSFVKRYPNLVLFSPVIFVGLFGLYAASVVLYRTFTFRNCKQAAKELQREIVEARDDLRKLGYHSKNDSH